MESKVWTSPDGENKKSIITKGKWGLKPTENCECNIIISCYKGPDAEKYCGLSKYVIGDCFTRFEQLLDMYLASMLPGEVAQVTLKGEETFTLELVSFTSSGLICEWNAQEKYNLAFKHKSVGVNLFKTYCYLDAYHRFVKGLKILCSIPIDISEPPVELDGIKVEVIEDLKAILYNNLASCCLKSCDYERVLLLCDKVFERDTNNIKALYKQSLAMRETFDFEGSQRMLKRILELEPNNKIAVKMLQDVNLKVAEDNVRVNAMIKKMFPEGK